LEANNSVVQVQPEVLPLLFLPFLQICQGLDGVYQLSLLELYFQYSFVEQEKV